MNHNQPNGETYQYKEVLAFHLVSLFEGKEYFNDMTFAKIDGVWKFIIPGLSPQIK
jgi:hypothetical protein